MRPTVRFFVLALGLVALAGCSSSDLVVAPTDDDGGLGADAAPDVETLRPDTAPVDDARSPDSSTPADASHDDADGAAEDADLDAPVDASVDAEVGDADGGLGDAPASDGDALALDADALALDADGLTLDADVLTLDADALALDADAGCDVPLRCYFDRDGDDYVAAAGAFDACVCPPGTKTIPVTGSLFDCHDVDPSIHPGAGFRDGPYCVLGTSCTVKSFDYDCNGTEDKELGSSFGGCATFGAGCGGAGWQGAVPGCGAAQNFTTCSKATLSCAQATASRTQRCR